MVAELVEQATGCGMNLLLLFLLFGCVVAETHECGSSDPRFTRPGNSCGETAGSRVVESSEWDCAMLDDSDDDDWPDGGYPCSREGRQVEQQRESMAQVELRDESARCGRRPAAVGCGEQRAAWRSAMVCRLDHVAHGKRLESQLEYVDSGIGSFVGHERCGGRSLTRNGRRRDLFKIIQRCFREFWKKQRLKSSCAGTTRDRERPNVTGNRGTTTLDSRKVFKDVRQQRKEQLKCKCHECGKFGLGVRSNEASVFRSKQEKLGRDEMRRHGERRSECAGDRISVVVREKSRDSGWNRFVCCSDCVRSFSLVRDEKLQVLYGSECSDASGARRMAGTVSGVAIEPQLDEQVVCQYLTGEFVEFLV